MYDKALITLLPDGLSYERVINSQAYCSAMYTTLIIHCHHTATLNVTSITFATDKIKHAKYMYHSG